MERILLHGQVAEEIGILAHISRDLLDEFAALPGVVDVDGALGQVVAHNVEGRDGPEGPVQVLKDLHLPIAEGEGGNVGLAALSGELGHLEELGDDRAVLLGLLVLGRDGDAGGGEELPLVALHLGLGKDFVHKQNRDMDGAVVEMVLLAYIAHPIDQVSAVRKVVCLGIVGRRSHKVALSLEHVLVQIFRRYTKVVIDV